MGGENFNKYWLFDLHKNIKGRPKRLNSLLFFFDDPSLSLIPQLFPAIILNFLKYNLNCTDS